MTVLTLESVSAEHQRLGELIAKLAAQAKFGSLFPMMIQTPEARDDRTVDMFVSPEGGAA